MTSSHSLCHPGYPCPRCDDTSETSASRLVELSARIENMRRENILEREQAQQARAQRLQQQQERIANAAEGRLKNSLSFEDAIENLMRRNHEAER